MVIPSDAPPTVTNPAIKTVLITGPEGAGTSTALATLGLGAICRPAGTAGRAPLGDWFQGAGPVRHGAAGPVAVAYISDALGQVIDAILKNKRGPTTPASAVGAAAEALVLDQAGARRHYTVRPAKSLQEGAEFDSAGLAREFLKYDAVVFMFRGPTATPTIATKHVLNLTADYQRPNLRYPFRESVAAAVEVTAGLTAREFAREMPADYATVVRHQGSAVSWNDTDRKFELTARVDGQPVDPGELLSAFHGIGLQLATRSLPALGLRNLVPYLRDVVVVFNHADITARFVPAVTPDDWREAFAMMRNTELGERYPSQDLVVGHGQLLLQPYRGRPSAEPPSEQPADPAEPAADGTPAKPARRRAGPRFTRLAADLTGAETVWAAIDKALARRTAVAPPEPPAPPEPVARPITTRLWDLVARRGATPNKTVHAAN